jgi:predicted permease
VQTRQSMNKLVLYVFLPALVFRTVMDGTILAFVTLPLVRTLLLS